MNGRLPDDQAMVRYSGWRYGLLVMASLVFAYLLAAASCRRSSDVHWEDLSTQCTEGTLSFVAAAIVVREHEGLPVGDGVSALYGWLEAKHAIPELRKQVGLEMLDERQRVIRDAWGKPLRYVYPPRHDGVLCELYSVGKNGIDEDGRGDDMVEQRDLLKQ